MSKLTIQDILNDLTTLTIYNRLKNLALNLFEWEGLPDGMRPEYIERLLYTYGKALYFNDPKQGQMCLKANPEGGQNAYGEWQKFQAFGYNYSESYSVDNAVLIRNNATMNNTEDYILLYAERLADITRTMDVNVAQQKTPKVVACDKNDELTFKAIFKKIQGNEPAIYVDKNMNINALEVLDISAPYVCDKLMVQKHEIENEVLTFLGINNSNTQKKERLVTNEVESNNDYIEFNALLMLNTRERACEEINAMFGTNITVKRKEAEQDGTVHAGTKGAGGVGDKTL